MDLEVGFTGTGNGMSTRQMEACRRHLISLQMQGHRVFHHGDCVGADAQAHDIAHSLGYHIVIHPPSNPKARAGRYALDIREPKPYLERNLDIVRESDILIAAPMSNKEVLRSGTWATVRQARKQGITVIQLER